MTLIECPIERAPEVMAIFNHEILNSTGLYEYQPRTLETVQAWFRAKHSGRFPVIGAIADDGTLAGFASYGPFRSFPAYKYSVEHSVYVRADQRGRGVGRRLLQEVLAAAQREDYHMVIGGIDAENTASIRLHVSVGFTPCARIRHAGFKFGRWLDLAFYQYLLPTPAQPQDG